MTYMYKEVNIRKSKIDNRGRRRETSRVIDFVKDEHTNLDEFKFEFGLLYEYLNWWMGNCYGKNQC